MDVWHAAAVAQTPAEARTVTALAEARERTLALVASVSDEDLKRVHSELMSPLVWDLGHIAAFEDLWIVHRYGGRPLLREGLADIYDAFEAPRARRGDLPSLRPAEATEYLAEVRSRTLEVIGQRGIEDGVICELVLRHEQQHNETMLQTLQLARLDGYRPPGPVPDTTGLALVGAGGLELIEIPAGPCTVGAPAEGFARSRAPVGGRAAAGPRRARQLDQLARGTAPAATSTAGASPYGCLAMFGDVWEWTSTEFAGYEGFSAFPYPEYSEVFFAKGYRTLRGGSWATRARVAAATFRN